MSDTPAIPDEVTLAGEKVKSLKAAKAPVEEIKAAVAELLELKKKHGLLPPPKEKKKKEKKKESGPSKKELRILERQKKAAAAAAKKEAEAAAGASTFGDNTMIQSKVITDRVWVEIKDLESVLNKKTWIRASVQNIQAKGKSCFLLLRQGVSTVQGCMFQSKEVSKAMIKYTSEINKESVVDIYGTIVPVADAISSASHKHLEVQVEQIFTVSKAAPELPFQVTDASRTIEELEEKNEDGTPKYVSVLQDTRLDYRWIDLRTTANQAIMRIGSMVSTLFREFLLSKGFMEMHTPKLLGGASEGGADVFRFKYFGRDACLSQSPQLFKQMVAAASGFERCFEIGPVFRAENSNTPRHLCEFTGMDFEMTIKEHYFEALDVFSGLFIHIFDGIAERCKPELAAVQAQYPFKPIKYLNPSLRLTFAEGIKLLHDAGYTDADPEDDLTTEHEKALGDIVAEKFGTDFYMLDKYPLGVRPFYTMPDPENPKLSNSYDMFIRGQEIVSGAQRIHDIDLLVERAKHWEIPLDTISGYLDSFRHGAQPHAGGGIGLERVVFLYLGLNNIRKTSMFPRDPKRLTP